MSSTISSACPCINRTTVSPSPVEYPLWRKDQDNITAFRKHGYLVVKGLLTGEEVETTKQEISRIILEWYERFNTSGVEGVEHEEIVNRLPTVKSGTQSCQDPELEVRKLYRISANFEFFANQCCHPSIVAIVNQLLGTSNVKLIQSMALLKPPGSGEKIWHQDNAYFRLTPPKVLGCWIALDPASCANGCMHILPSSHGSGLYEHGVPNEDKEAAFIDYGMIKQPNPDDVIPIVLEPGDALVFHGETAHYTPPNVSQLRRRSLQYHYASSECRTIKCPRDEEVIREQTIMDSSKPHYFDCDPSCQEAKYFHYKKAELLVSGQEYGDRFI